MEVDLELAQSAQILQMTQQQKETMLTALSNPLILHKIIEACDFPQLKICRHVNSTWNLVSCHVILRLESCFITFRSQVGNEEKFYRVSRNGRYQFDERENNLSKFNQLLESSNQIFDQNLNFPCSDFKFIHGDLGGPCVQKFFKIHGPHLTSLRLRGFNDDRVKTSKSNFHQILLNSVPNIRSLYITNFEYDWGEDEFSAKFPFLKKFKWIGCPSTASKILQNSSNPKLNLPLLNVNTMEDLDMLEKFEKITLVKDFIYFRDYDHRNLEKFANLAPKLQILRISDPDTLDRNTAADYQKILNSCRDSLEILRMSNILTRFGIGIPKLMNLTKLILVMETAKKIRRTWRIFPARIHLPETFPFVRILDCSSLLAAVAGKNENWDKVFPPPLPFEGTFEGVQVLKIFHNSTELWLSRLHHLCPNFRKIVVTNGNEVFDSQILDLIFRLWTHLTAIEILLDGSDHENFLMDPAISGVPKETCNQWLFTDASITEIENESKIFAHRPSIKDLHELKELRVRLGKSDVILPQLPFSRISGLCSFKWMPGLKVILHFDHYEIFNSQRQTLVYDELSSFVNIRHTKLRTY